jgi:recombination protein RecR
VFSKRVEHLIESLRALPGVGRKSAQRMAFHLLDRDPEGARALARALDASLDGVKRCVQCRMFSDDDLCGLCAAPGRDRAVLCAVESPADVIAVEQATGYRGLYFVLMGHLSPLDGIGPTELGLEAIERRMHGGEVKELIIATNPTVEGEATAHYLAQLAREQGVKPTRIAHGVPVGGELEYVDGGTIAHAFSGRLEVK